MEDSQTVTVLIYHHGVGARNLRLQFNASFSASLDSPEWILMVYNDFVFKKSVNWRNISCCTQRKISKRLILSSIEHKILKIKLYVFKYILLCILMYILLYILLYIKYILLYKSFAAYYYLRKKNAFWLVHIACKTANIIQTFYAKYL